MSEIQRSSNDPAGSPADQSLLPPGAPDSWSSPVPSWAPPPPPAPPAPPANNSFWHRLAAGVVVLAVIAAAAGAGLGGSLARTINSHPPTAQAAHPSPQSESPLQPTSPNNNGSLNVQAIAAKVDPAIVDINTVVGSGRA